MKSIVLTLLDLLVKTNKAASHFTLSLFCGLIKSVCRGAKILRKVR